MSCHLLHKKTANRQSWNSALKSSVVNCGQVILLRRNSITLMTVASFSLKIFAGTKQGGSGVAGGTQTI